MTNVNVSVADIAPIVSNIKNLADKLMDDHRVEKGWQFFSDSKATAESILAGTTKAGHGTLKQKRALTNMLSGLERWEANLEEE